MYCTYADLLTLMSESTVIQLTDEVNAGVVDSAMVSAIIADAQEEIDGYLRGRYSLPLTVTPTLLRGICARVARYKLYERRGEQGIPDGIKTSYTGAVDILKQIRSGVVTVGITTGEAAPEPGKTFVNKIASDRVFPDDVLEGF
jgi:phage gp36-like protein